jgi:hypothetical protein
VDDRVVAGVLTIRRGHLTFASAIATGALAALGLTAHELRAERVVHSLEAAQTKASQRRTGFRSRPDLAP